MISQSLKLISVSTLLCALGCASEPNKEVQEAHQANQEQQRDSSAEQAQLNQQQAEEQAELARKQRSEQAELGAENRQQSAAESKSISQAQAEMTEERRNFTADADKRIQKADAKANELLTKSQTLPAKKKAKFEVAWNDYKSKRDGALEKTKSAQTATSTDWARTKPEAEKSLEHLEESVDNLDKVF